LAAFVASLLAIACRRATVASGTKTIIARRRAIVDSGLAPGPGDLGLIRFQRVADRGVDVSLSGGSVSRLGCTVSGVSRAIGLVEVVLPGHGTESVATSRKQRLRRAAST
jgi:hypothetical protein